MGMNINEARRHEQSLCINDSLRSSTDLANWGYFGDATIAD
jgi:hypothetical protein